MIMNYTKIIFMVALLLVGIVTVYASHSWGNYHWGRINNPFTLRIGDNLSTNWDSYLATTSSDWNISSVLDTSIVPGLTTGKRCRATNGRIEACNYKYGRNGWLGLAQIWVNGDHITQGIAKVNDSYFNFKSLVGQMRNHPFNFINQPIRILVKVCNI